MSQHDYNIANGGGAAVRADLNNALLAILSQNSGATAPTTTKPFMFWYDTTVGVLKMRNAADTAWIAAIDGVANGNPVGMKNRIINGSMAIAQRGTSSSDGGYNVVDRFRYSASLAGKATWGQNQGGVTPPAGFTNYLGFTSASAYSVGSGERFAVEQYVEGLNVADLGWGTADAKPVTLSFWVRSSLTGTFGGALQNSATNRSYPFSYTVSSANTWEQKTVTIAGDTSGTWLTDNGVGIRVCFSIGSGSSVSGTAGAWAGAGYYSATGAVSVVGTNAATWQITGVQLEKGSIATAFDWRPYGQELALCQRYYYRVTKQSAGGTFFGAGYNYSSTQALINVPFKTTMRTNPTALEQSGTASHYEIMRVSGNSACTAVPTFENASVDCGSISLNISGGLTAASGVLGIIANSSGYLGWSAEL